MSKKDFKRGVEAAIKTNEAFMRKQAAATEELGKRIIQKIDDQGKIIDVILDTLNAQEKKELYALQSEYDIADLGENEKEVLASFLLTLISKYEQDTDEQKDYYFAVKKHLGVTDVSDDFDLALVENVDSRAELKAMFSTVCEFLFLKTGDISFLDTFEDELEYFGLTPKAIREIIAPIVKIYDILGLRGIVEHYIPAEAEENLFPDHYGLILPVSDEIVLNESNSNISAGTEKIFENARVTFTSQFCAEGNVLFKNCEIVFDYDDKITFFEKSTGEVDFQNCEFITKKQASVTVISVSGKCTFKDCLISGVKYYYGKKESILCDSDGDSIDYNCSFIDVDGYSRTAELIIEHCRIENCEGTFINADGMHLGKNYNITVQNSAIDNHTGNFIYACDADKENHTGIKISGSTFSNAKCYPKNNDDYDWSDSDKPEETMIVSDDTSLSCTDCEFSDIEQNVINMSTLFSSGLFDIRNCKFKKCTQRSALLGIIENCEFSDMTNIAFGDLCGEESKGVMVSECTFTHINGKIRVKRGIIKHCNFTDSVLTVVVTGNPSGIDRFHSEGNNLTFTNCVAFTGKTEISEGGLFDWASEWLDNTPCLLQAKSGINEKDECVSFNGCKFINCRTSGCYINTESSYSGAFGRTKTVTVGYERGTIIE